MMIHPNLIGILMKKILITFVLFTIISALQTASAIDTKLELLDVTGIKQGSSLNMYEWPSLTSTIVLAIPHNAQAITYKGSLVRQGEKTWKKVYWNGNKGWVNAGNLKRNQDKARKVEQQQKKITTPVQPINTQATTTTVTTTNKKQTILACGGSKPFWNMHMNLTGKNILVDLQDGNAFSVPLNNRKWDISKNEMRITGGQDKQAIKATLNKTNTCTDGLTAIKYPFTINVTIGNNKQIKGCCRTVQK